jgi:hypothetical protein
VKVATVKIGWFVQWLKDQRDVYLHHQRVWYNIGSAESYLDAVAWTLEGSERGECSCPVRRSRTRRSGTRSSSRRPRSRTQQVPCRLSRHAPPVSVLLAVAVARYCVITRASIRDATTSCSRANRSTHSTVRLLSKLGVLSRLALITLVDIREENRVKHRL